jgi:formylglycine-generating enzyme required for sulfatase activity
MFMRKIVFVFFLLLILYCCSENPVQPEKRDFTTDWITVNAGSYTHGKNKEIRLVDYNYAIMKYEITNAQYLSYLNELYSKGYISISEQGVEGYYTDENIEGNNYLFYNFGNYLQFPDMFHFGKIFFDGEEFKINPGYENHPVVLVTYYGAAAFAKYYGLRLPTEDEWEKAARGNTGWNYSWGDTINVHRANYLSGGEYGMSDPFESGTTPVGFYNGERNFNFSTIDSPSPYGVYDLTGNVHEWINSYISFPGHHRMIRGGSWFFGNSYWLYTWFRHNHSPGFSCEYVGFRCVKDL